MPYKMKVRPEEMNSLADIFRETDILFKTMTGEWSEYLFESDDAELLKTAYWELHDESYNLIYDQLETPSEELLGRLEIVGLHPNQAQFKVKRRGIRRVWRSFINNPVVKILRHILAFINDLFASIVKVIMHAGAWDEIKKVFEKFMKKFEGLLPVEPEENFG